MRTNHIKSFISAAQRCSGVFSVLTRDCISNERIDIGMLMRKVTQSSYAVKPRQAEHGVWCEIFKGDILVAQGYSSDKEDAFAHAVFGVVREEDAKEQVSDLLKREGIAVADDVQAKMESNYIQAGGLAGVTAQVEYMKFLQNKG